MRVDVKPDLILWACERAGRSIDSLAQKQSFRKLPTWISGDASPTLRLRQNHRLLLLRANPQSSENGLSLVPPVWTLMVDISCYLRHIEVCLC